jgi:hypothetical protein
MSDRVRPEPAKNKTTNWMRYNHALKCGALMVWLNRDLLNKAGSSGKQPGNKARRRFTRRRMLK